MNKQIELVFHYNLLPCEVDIPDVEYDHTLLVREFREPVINHYFGLHKDTAAEGKNRPFLTRILDQKSAFRLRDILIDICNRWEKESCYGEVISE